METNLLNLRWIGIWLRERSSRLKFWSLVAPSGEEVLQLPELPETSSPVLPVEVMNIAAVSGPHAQTASQRSAPASPLLWIVYPPQDVAGKEGGMELL